ncbi:MAG: glycosyltransferase family 2 protein [Prevotellaceae bacterium]|jgi:glycosyltransferase involved in cell wall biosynthesis|nr:glycosyltransferase family 2 protein [Prevotellaceae bacterium]
MDISVVIPLYNEEESLPELVEWIERVMNENNFSFEIILVDDGSSDSSWQVIETLAENKNFIHAICFRRNYGKSAALYCGFGAAKGNVVITMDADLQDSPDEIPELYKMIAIDGYDLISGWKKKRYDSKISKNIPSKFFNGITRLISGIKLHDFNCGLKAYRAKVIKSIEVYGEMHRYIPVLAKQAGFRKIGEKIVQHRARKYGVTKFGMSRFINGFLDLLSIVFITKFGKKPMHFFGIVGTLMFLLGGGISIWLIARKLYCLSNGIMFREITSQPLFYISLVTIIIGVQLFLAGFLGELISRSSNERNKYFIDKEI